MSTLDMHGAQSPGRRRSSAARIGAAAHHTHLLVPQMRRAPIVAAEQDGEAGLPFEQRGHVYHALDTHEDHQSAFTASEDLTGRRMLRTLMDVTILRGNLASGAPLMARPALRAFQKDRGSVAPQFEMCPGLPRFTHKTFKGCCFRVSM